MWDSLILSDLAVEVGLVKFGVNWSIDWRNQMHIDS